MDQQQKPRWWKRVLWLGGALVALLVVLVLIRIGYAHSWTGFSQSKVTGDVRLSKTLWDWLDLLIVPVVLALGGYLFTRSENRRTQMIADQQRAQEREIADQRSQDATLQAYLDQIGELLLDKDRPLRESKVGDEVRTLARARTLTVLARLERVRSSRVMQFLYESGLITKPALIIDLNGANLRKVHLGWKTDLNLVVLRETDLREAFLAEATLYKADLSRTILYKATLNKSDLREANLSKAFLHGANLKEADLRDADLSGADLSGSDLGEADLRRADLRGANLRGATLTGTALSGADLSGVDLSGAHLLSQVKLRNLDWSGSDETAVMDDIYKEIERQAKSLEGATMPNGQKYEDWLKDREGGEEDGENE